MGCHFSKSQKVSMLQGSEEAEYPKIGCWSDKNGKEDMEDLMNIYNWRQSPDDAGRVKKTRLLSVRHMPCKQ